MPSSIAAERGAAAIAKLECELDAPLPLALLTPDMRVRQVIDVAFAEHALTVTPQVETDSVSSLLAQAATGDWAGSVPHTWLWAGVAAGRRCPTRQWLPGLAPPSTV